MRGTLVHAICCPCRKFLWDIWCRSGVPRSRVLMWLLASFLVHMFVTNDTSFTKHRFATWNPLSDVMLSSKLQFILGLCHSLDSLLCGVGFRMLKGPQQRKKAIMTAMRTIMVGIKMHLPSGIQMTKITNSRIISEAQILN